MIQSHSLIKNTPQVSSSQQMKSISFLLPQFLDPLYKCVVGTSMSCLSANDLHRIFQKLDKNGDGLISIDQLKWLLEKIGFQTSLDELQPLMGRGKSLDSIDFFFFYDVIKNQNKAGDDDSDEWDSDLMKAFKVFDLNDDGFISCEELQSVLSRLGLLDEQNSQEYCKSMISMYDMNLDGLLDFEEFKFMMLSDSS